jgi:cytochrome c peroxidase
MRRTRTEASVVLTLALVSLSAVVRAHDGGAPLAKAEVVTSGSYSVTLPLGLQAGSSYIPENNPLTADKIALGKLLYFDARMSNDKSVSCASCHNPFHGFADPGRTSKGVGFKLGARNSPTVINRLFSKEQFWDGRAADLEAQAHGPLTNPIEMAMPSEEVVVKRIAAIKGYAPLFQKAFGSPQVTMTKIAQAIAAYERTVVAGNSPYDRYQAGDKRALSAAAVHGMELFKGKANCQVCHASFNFTDESYHDIGVGMDKPKPDLGRFDQTKAETDRGAFKTPTLRNVTESAPYMHDGSESTLHQVVDFYNKGGVKNPQLSKEIKPLNLQSDEIADLIAFLESLTGEIENAEPPASLPQ